MRMAAQLPGRKIVFMVSDGFYLNDRKSGSMSRIKRITDAAGRAGVVINTLDARGIISEMLGADNPSPIAEGASMNIGEVMASPAFRKQHQPFAFSSAAPKNHERAQNRPPDCKTRTGPPDPGRDCAAEAGDLNGADHRNAWLGNINISPPASPTQEQILPLVAAARERDKAARERLYGDAEFVFGRGRR